MAYDAVAFLSGGNRLSERERTLVKRLAGRDVLFLVTDAEGKSEILRDYICSAGFQMMNVIFLRNNDSGYVLPYLARETSKKNLDIDITFAPSYYASAVTLLAMRSGVRITYTEWDGTLRVIYQSPGPKTEFGSITSSIVECLSAGPKTLSELEEETGLNYKTLARRTAALLNEGAISRTEEYPIRYYATDEQVLACRLSCGSDAEGTVFRNAAEALFSRDRVVLNRSIPHTGEMDLETGSAMESPSLGPDSDSHSFRDDKSSSEHREKNGNRLRLDYFSAGFSFYFLFVGGFIPKNNRLDF